VTQEAWLADEIEITVSGFFTTHHSMQSQAGSLGTLTLSAFASGGVFRALDGRELEVRRTNWWRGEHELRENGITVGMARLRGFWRRTTSVGFRGAAYELEPTNVWSRGWRLTDAAGMAVLEIQPLGVFRRGARLTVLGPVHVDLLLFAYYLVNVRWQEQSAAAASAGS
jgi:hypothetical protein